MTLQAFRLKRHAFNDYYAAAINPDGRHDKSLAPRGLHRACPTLQEFPGSFFKAHPDLFCWR